DQYTISITGTGINPLASPAVRSASYIKASDKTQRSTTPIAQVIIPQIRIGDNLFDVVLNQLESKGGELQFELASSIILPDALITTAIQPAYNPVNHRVKIPKLTIQSNGDSYSIELQYYPAVEGKAAYLELIGMIPIQ
ncbi:MAG: hypothetical protein QM479_13505, partial [Pseudomonadota bacterium]